MAYRVDLTERALRDLRRLHRQINAEESMQARDWFVGLERMVLSLDAIDNTSRVVTVLHVRHGARDAFAPDTDGDGAA